VRETLKSRGWWVAATVVVGAVGLLRIWPARAVLPGGIPGAGYFLWAYRHFAYSDLVAEYELRHLSTHALLYVHQYFEYPPGIGLVVWLTAWLPGLGGYLIGNAAVLTAALGVSTWTAALVRGADRVRAWMLSPLLLIYGIYNWDLLGIACWGVAVWQWTRRRWFWSGVFVGLGAGTKLFPLVLWPYMAAGLLRQGDRRAATAVTVGTGLGFAVLNVPVMAANLSGWAAFWTYNDVRGPDPGLWQWVYLHHWLTVPDINAITLALVAAGAVWLLVAVWRGGDPIRAAALLLTWWLLCNKVYSPQYVIWALYVLTLSVDWRWDLWLVNITGWLDFLLAMVWLALGTAGSPYEPIMGIYVAPVVILVRDVTYALVLRRHRLSVAEQARSYNVPVGERT